MAFSMPRHSAALSRFSSLALSLLLLIGVSSAVSGCEPDFEPRSKLSSLRILGVQADAPYPRPGQDVHLKMLWHDGKSPLDKPRNVQVVWIAGCENPAGDMYYGCYPQLAEKLAKMGKDPKAAEGLIGIGDEFTLHVPSDIVSSRPAPPTGDPYGLTYVFFAACAGRIGPLPKEQAGSGLPIGCFGPDGQQLGADDFVPGYMGLYSYEKKENTNPVVTALTLDGQELSDDKPVHIPRCDGDCAKLDLKAIVDPSSVEWNDGYSGPEGQRLHEVMWVEYFATSGDLKSSTKLVNDALNGFREDDAAEYKPPSEPGEVELYGVVRDNRGGTAWVKGRIVVD